MGNSEVIPDPREKDLPAGQIRLLYEHWSRLFQIEGVADAKSVHIPDLGAVAGLVSLAEFVSTGFRIKFAHLNPALAAMSGLTVTDQYLDNLPEGSHLSRFLHALYHASLLYRVPTFSTLPASEPDCGSTWQQLALPIGEQGRASKLLIGVWRSSV
ncbi:MAG: hypothetical protein ACMVY4_02660 [Minwuia sp.]|uniref:hypothetical protein n=1 Tax=Minwuia sp. TaxID=2493630 RepID=UPI003A88ECFA